MRLPFAPPPRRPLSSGNPHSSPLSRQLTRAPRACSQPISEQQVKDLCLKAREILVEEANIQWIDSPVTVRPPLSAGSGSTLHTS